MSTALYERLVLYDLPTSTACVIYPRLADIEYVYKLKLMSNWLCWQIQTVSWGRWNHTSKILFRNLSFHSICRWALLSLRSLRLDRIYQISRHYRRWKEKKASRIDQLTQSSLFFLSVCVCVFKIGVVIRLKAHRLMSTLCPTSNYRGSRTSTHFFT